MRLGFVLLFFILVCRPGAAEPAFGQLIGVENDFLKYRCAEESESQWNCDFRQILMSSKVKPDQVEEEIELRLQDAEDQLSEFQDESDKVCSTVLEISEIVPEVIDALVKGDETAALDAFNRLPEGMRGGTGIDEIRQNVFEGDKREQEDMVVSMRLFARLCQDQSLAALEAVVRHEVEKEARTCKLFVNEWSDTFEKVSDKLWVISGGGTRGECGIVRLDRFECRGAYLCDFVSEKRILNPDEETVIGIPCSGLDDGEYRYSFDGDGVYLQCEIMSFY